MELKTIKLAIVIFSELERSSSGRSCGAEGGGAAIFCKSTPNDAHAIEDRKTDGIRFSSTTDTGLEELGLMIPSERRQRYSSTLRYQTLSSKNLNVMAVLWGTVQTH